MNELNEINDKVTQQAHATEMREARQAQEFKQKNPELARFAQMLQLCRDAKPAWFGQHSAAERNTFASAKNMPRSLTQQAKNRHRKQPSRSGVEGGSITFVVCKDNGDGTFTQGKVTADATFVADA